MSDMRDLFDPDPRAGLNAALAEVDGPDPDAAIWARMHHADSGFGRAGGGGISGRSMAYRRRRWWRA